MTTAIREEETSVVSLPPKAVKGKRELLPKMTSVSGRQPQGTRESHTNDTKAAKTHLSFSAMHNHESKELVTS